MQMLGGEVLEWRRYCRIDITTLRVSSPFWRRLMGIKDVEGSYIC